MKFLLPFLVCLSCYAQLPVTPWTIPVSGAKDIPSLIQTPILRWKRSDLSGSQALNSNVVYWLDEIISLPWSQTTVANQPTNALLGVHFLGSQFMTVTNGPQGFKYSSNELFIALQVDSFPAQSCFVGFSGAGGFGMGFDSTGHFIDTHNGTTLAVSPIPTGTNVNFICSQDNTTGASTCNTWTNGVAARVGLNQAGENFTIDNLGANQSAGGAVQFYKGYIQELIVWYNTNFNAAAVSNLHYYSTNLYGGWP